MVLRVGSGGGVPASGPGSGDVVGPASATDNAIVRFDGTTGKLVQNSGVTISDTGLIVGVDGASGASAKSLTLGSGGGFYSPGAGALNYQNNTTADVLQLSAGSISMASNVFFGWASTTNSIGYGPTVDVILARDAANTLAQRNGVNAQAFRVYETYTDASNYERLSFSSTGGFQTIGTEAAGSGTASNLVLAAGGTTKEVFISVNAATLGTVWKWTASGHLITTVDNTYDIGANGATRPRAGYFGASVNVDVGSWSANGLLLALGTGFIQWTSRSVLRSPANGELRITDAAETGFTGLLLGPSGTTFNRLKHGGTGLLQVRLADDSAFASIQGIHRTEANAVTGLTAGVLAATTNATITISDASGQVYRVPVII